MFLPEYMCLLCREGPAPVRVPMRHMCKCPKSSPNLAELMRGKRAADEGLPYEGAKGPRPSSVT